MEYIAAVLTVFLRSKMVMYNWVRIYIGRLLLEDSRRYEPRN